VKKTGSSISYIIVVLLLLFVSTTRGSAQSGYTTTTVSTGRGPTDVAVNPATNKVYVSNSTNQNVSVIDGTTDTVVATVDAPDGLNPQFIAVNSATNKIYVTYGGNANGEQVNGLMKIDGASNATVATYPLPLGANAFAINPATNLIYVADSRGNALLVFDGNLEGPNIPPVLSVPVGTSPQHVAVNSLTNKIYVGNIVSRDVTVVDGKTDATATIPLDRSPAGIAVNPANNKVYFVEPFYVYGANGEQLYNSEMTVIDGNDNSSVILTIDGLPDGFVAVNPNTNNVYVSSYSQNVDGTFNPGTVTVIYGNNNEATVTSGTYPDAIAVDPATNRIYVTNWELTGYNNDNPVGDVTIIDGRDNSAGSVGVGSLPIAVAVNPFTHKAYVANNNSDDVTVITPPSTGNTPTGTNISVTPALGLTVTFSQVTAAGDTTAVASSSPPPPAGFQLDGQIYDISTTATYVPPVTVCLGYTPSDLNPQLFHYENVPPQQWVDRTVSVDTVNHVVCGIVSSLSPFAVFVPHATVVSRSQVSTTASGLAYSRVTQTFNGTVTLTNISSSAISAPLQILFTGMPANVTLVNATGNLSGTPYVTVPVASLTPGQVPSLAPGQSVTVPVQFKNLSNVLINSTPVIYSGSIN
jgi:YVTN family beta-propeller protein